MARRALGRKCGSVGSPFVPSAKSLESRSIEGSATDPMPRPAWVKSERRVIVRRRRRSSTSSGLSGHLFRASSRLKNWLATMVHAASSGAGMEAIGDESPTATSALEAFSSRA